MLPFMKVVYEWLLLSLIWDCFVKHRFTPIEFRTASYPFKRKNLSEQDTAEINFQISTLLPRVSSTGTLVFSFHPKAIKFDL